MGAAVNGWKTPGKRNRLLTAAEAEMRAQSELQADESLVWSGVPDARRAALSAIPDTLLPGILFTGVALFLLLYGYVRIAAEQTSSHPRSSILGGLMMVGIFLMFGLINLLRPVWVYRRGLNTVYAVTNRRVMFITGNGNGSVRSLKPADIHSVNYRERSDGSGEVMIRTEFSWNNRADTTKLKRGWLYGVPDVRTVAQEVSALSNRSC